LRRGRGKSRYPKLAIWALKEKRGKDRRRASCEPASRRRPKKQRGTTTCFSEPGGKKKPPVAAEVTGEKMGVGRVYERADMCRVVRTKQHR